MNTLLRDNYFVLETHNIAYHSHHEHMSNRNNMLNLEEALVSGIDDYVLESSSVVGCRKRTSMPAIVEQATAWNS